MLYFQKTFKWDFMKINPRADFHVEDWGFKHKWSTDEFKKHEKLFFPIQKLEDWGKIKPLDVRSKALDEHLKVVSLIRKGVDKELPILMTLFSPLAIAGRMVADRAKMAEQIHEHPDIILEAVESITETYVKYTEELRNAGADGIFFATTQWASSNLISWEEYQKFGVPFDLRILKAAGDDSLNLFHICSSNNFLRQLIKEDYPVQMYNWETDDPTNPPLDIGVDLIPDKGLVGGVDHLGWLLQASPAEIGAKIDELKEKYDSSRIIFGPGCAIPPEVPFENLQAIRERL